MQRRFSKHVGHLAVCAYPYDCACRKLNPGILVMQSAQDLGDKESITRCRTGW
jgi:hypothetical protein